jgi:hypothetical protein
MMTTTLRWTFGLALLASTAACAADPEPGSPDAGGGDPAALAGSWAGTTDDGGPVTFEISEDGTLTELAIELEISVGTGTCTGTFEAAPNVTIEDGAVIFTGTLSNAGGSVDAELTAAFADGTATGTYDVSSFAIVCGGSFSFGSGGPAGELTAQLR